MAEILEKIEQDIKISGEVLPEIPGDLYIPPEALRVVLEIFEGPLDLLLYLIRKHNIDILDIPVAKITHQYVQYVELMKACQFELVADYLEMAAILTEVKSKMLLPKPVSIEEEEDPRAELVRRLQEYERIKKAADHLENLPRHGRELFSAHANPPAYEVPKAVPQIDLTQILIAFHDVLKRVDLLTSHAIQAETVSVRERMSIILSSVSADNFIAFSNFFNLKEGRLGVVVTFLAILELLKESLIDIVQSESFAPIYIRAAS